MIWLLGKAFGPTFAKEAIEIARRRRYYVARAAVALAMLVAIALAAYRLGPATSVASNKAAAAKQTEVAGVLAGNISAMLFAAIALLTPMFLCGAISGERQNGTLELLFTTQLTDREIVFGKFGSRMAVLGNMIVAALPVFALLTLIGGVSIGAIASAVAASLFAALIAGGLALYFTSVCRTPFGALGATYVAALGMALVLMPFVGILYKAVVEPPRDDSGWIGLALGLGVVFMVGISVCGALAYGAIRNLRLGPAPKLRQEREDRRPAAAVAEPEAPMPGPEQASALSQKVALWGPVRIPVDRDDPPLRKNLWVFGVLAAAFGVCLYVLAVVNPFESGRVGVALLPVWFVALAVALVLAVTNPLFTRRPGFFDDLLTTTLDGREILQGALFVSGPVALRLALVPWCLGLLWIAANPAGLLLANVLGTLFGLTLFAIGNAASLADCRLLHRLAAPFLFVALTWFGTWLLAGETYLLQGWAVAVFAGVLFAATALWARRSASALAAGSFLAAGHWAAVAGAAALVPWLAPKALEYGTSPLLWCNPLQWLYVLYVKVPDTRRWNPAWVGAVLYIGAMAVHVAGSYWWLGKNFDRLTGRTQARPG